MEMFQRAVQIGLKQVSQQLGESLPATFEKIPTQVQIEPKKDQKTVAMTAFMDQSPPEYGKPHYRMTFALTARDKGGRVIGEPNHEILKVELYEIGGHQAKLFASYDGTSAQEWQDKCALSGSDHWNFTIKKDLDPSKKYALVVTALVNKQKVTIRPEDLIRVSRPK
jgi:hypothetical protein